ncbi:MAG: anion permease, partial [Parvularculaceae bacterium]
MIAGRWPSVLAGLIICFCLLLLPPPEGMSESAWLVVALTALMAIWWVTEAIPIPVTGLLPLVFLPLSGVMPIAEAAVPYANRIIL